MGRVHPRAYLVRKVLRSHCRRHVLGRQFRRSLVESAVRRTRAAQPGSPTPALQPVRIRGTLDAAAVGQACDILRPGPSPRGPDRGPEELLRKTRRGGCPTKPRLAMMRNEE